MGPTQSPTIITSSDYPTRFFNWFTVSVVNLVRKIALNMGFRREHVAQETSRISRPPVRMTSLLFGVPQNASCDRPAQGGSWP